MPEDIGYGDTPKEREETKVVDSMQKNDAGRKLSESDSEPRNWRGK